MSEDEIIKQIESSFSKNDPKSALKLANKLLKKNPDNLLAFAYKGLSHLLLKEYKEATDIFYEIAHKINPTKPQNWYFLGRCYKEQKMYSEAIKANKKALELDMKYKKSLMDLEFCYREIKDFENAIKIGKKASEFYPKDLHFWYWISYTYFLMEDYPNSFLYLFKSKELYPESNDVKKLYDEIIVGYNNTIKSKQGYFAFKEINFEDGNIELRNKNISKIEEIDSLKFTRFYLSLLYLSDNNIQEISCLDNFTNLFSLHLDGNKVSKISGLETTPRLYKLYLQKNNINKIEGLDKLSNLNTLSLARNNINKIEGLEKNSKLTNLKLNNNNISEIEGLDKLRQLEDLDLSSNQIKKIEGISNLSELEVLDLAGNQIESMKDFSKLSKLKNLILSNNKITSIDNLELFKNLGYLDLRDNPDLPEFLAVLYDNAPAITRAKKYSGKSQKEIQEIHKQELREEEIRQEKKFELRRKETERWVKRQEGAGHYGSDYTSDYSSKHNLRKRSEALLKLDEPGSCLYCTKNIPNDVNFAKECEKAVNRLMFDVKLPREAKDRKDLSEREVTQYTDKGRYTLDGSWVDDYGFETRTIKEPKIKLVRGFNQRHFPKLQGIVCKECSDEFIKKASKYFNQLSSHNFKEKAFLQRIWRAMKKCHEDYMKLYESFLEKRKF